MFRGVRSLVKAADRFVRLPPSTAKLKQPLNAIFTHASALFPHHSPASKHVLPFAQDLSTLARSRVNIQSSLSLPARVALGRPLSAPFLPRAPTIPRHIAQVGLGTARNFSSSRPIFQHLAENVPIATRAFWEADWELRVREERAKTLKKMPSKQSNKAKKPKRANSSVSSSSSATINIKCAEPELFVTPKKVEPSVTTYLDIPLAPKTQRTPLPVIDSIDFLPVSHISAIHSAHEHHTIRVASLFRRLDAADVWSRGVNHECYGGEGGVPEFIRLIFPGWTEQEVRAVVGESINGWCTLECVERGQQDVERAPAPQSGTTSPSQPCSPFPSTSQALDMTLVMPTLDLSTPVGDHPPIGFPRSQDAPPSVCSDARSECGEDPWADDNWSEVNWTCPPSECGDMEDSQLSWADGSDYANYPSGIAHWDEPSLAPWAGVSAY